MKRDVIDILNFIPSTIVCNAGKGQEVNLSQHYDNEHIYLSYIVKQGNNANREHSFILPRFISKSKETFEVLGLLQAEMGKTNNGCINFSNSEPKIINKVINWFYKEFDLPLDNWKWYLKVNLNEPKDLEYKNFIENKCLEYWLKKSKIKVQNSYPKKVSYITNTIKIALEKSDYGTLMVEEKNNLFSQIIKNFLIIIKETMPNENIELIRSFMKGIIAGEGTVAYHPKSHHYGIHISAANLKEREIYKDCLAKLTINAKIYDDYKEMLISERENLVQLLKQRLMTLHLRKYAKFLNMMQKYPGISQETGYFLGKKKVWNKIPEEKIKQVIEIYNSGIIRTEDIAEKVGISQIKVQRVLKENNLGKRRNIYSEEKREEIADFVKNNLELTTYQIAEKFNVSQSAVLRACRKYNIKRGNESRIKIPEWKEKRIVEIYRQNPTVKISDIMNELEVSDSVVKRVKRENNLMNVGYKYLIGNNSKNIERSSEKASIAQEIG